MEAEEILIAEDNTLLEAMRRLDLTSRKILFINRTGKLAAALTDGDIRRWILSGGSLDAKVRDAANYHPLYLYEEERGRAAEFMKKHKIEAVPIVNRDMEMTSYILLHEGEAEPVKKISAPVVMMAGGLGSRLYPYTKILPKPLIPIGEIPIAEHIINRFHRYGCDRFYLVVNYKKNMIRAYFNELLKDYAIEYAEEEKPLGTGGGLSLLKGKIHSTFLLTNCDILIEEDYEKIYRIHKKENNLITMICSLKQIKIPYGIVEIDKNGGIKRMKEKPEFSVFTNTGMYVAEPRVIEELQENLAIDFPDLIEKYRAAGERIGVYPISENNWLDMGRLDSMEQMRKRLNKDE